MNELRDGTQQVEAFHRALLDSLDEGIAVLDEDGVVISVNAALERFARANPRCELRLGASYLAAVEHAGTDPGRAAIGRKLRAMLRGEGEGFSARHVLDPLERPPRWLAVCATRFCGEGAGRIVLRQHDCTQLVAAQRSARLRARLLEEIDAAVIAGDLDGTIRLWSRGAEKLYGWTAEEVVGRDVVDVIIPSERRPEARGNLAELKRTGLRDADRTLRRKDGSFFSGYVSTVVCHDDDGQMMGVSVTVDTTDRVQAARELLEARDHLRAVSDSMGEALCTLDDIGQVSYMNPAAERLLGWSVEQIRGRTLHEVVHYRRPDGSHYPIDECPLYTAHGARAAIRVSDDVFARRDGSGVPVSWVLQPFRSPVGQRSVIVFTDITQVKAEQQRLQRQIDELSGVRDLHEALQEDRFELFAQPIIELATGTVVAHELLLRMRERDGSLRAPGTFLPAAERCGLICELDRWVIGQAAALAGEGHRVELNLSALSLDDPRLFDHFAVAIADHGADPSLIVVELTETALLHEEEIARTFIERIAALGCELALDDFGTGFGGFAYLKRLPVDYLKIDVEFVRDIRTNAASRHVVEAVVSLAAAFGQRTVAEGVEDPETLAMIRAMGVDLAQGYGVGRPAPLADTIYRTR